MIRIKKAAQTRAQNAQELIRASDVLRTLQACERATGRRFVTGEDTVRARIAADAFDGVTRTHYGFPRRAFHR